MEARVAIALLRNRHVRGLLIAAVLLVLVAPVILASVVLSFAAEQEEGACGQTGTLEQPAGGGPLAGGLYAEPLALTPGRTYQVGATEYGGPGDPSSGSYGTIPDPSQSYLPAHPDSFAELSVLDQNPANGGSFSFTDADALNHLPYLSALRVTHAGRSELLFKRDIGYGQGPGQTIENGQPYRLDVWWQAAAALHISKSAVEVSLAPATGSAAALGAVPEGLAETTGASCPLAEGAGAPLPLSAGTQTKVLPSGLAAAGVQAPAAVKAMVAAGNRLYGSAYLYGGAHGSSLDTLQPAYDCSSAVSYLLHGGGVLSPSALDSGELESYGEPGPGRFVSIYANAAHTFIYVAGLRFDTVEAPAYDSGPNAGKSGPRWRVSPSVPGWASWIVRHPAGL